MPSNSKRVELKPLYTLKIKSKTLKQILIRSKAVRRNCLMCSQCLKFRLLNCEPCPGFSGCWWVTEQAFGLWRWARHYTGSSSINKLLSVPLSCFFLFPFLLLSLTIKSMTISHFTCVLYFLPLSQIPHFSNWAEGVSSPLLSSHQQQEQSRDLLSILIAEATAWARPPRSCSHSPGCAALSPLQVEHFQ